MWAGLPDRRVCWVNGKNSTFTPPEPAQNTGIEAMVQPPELGGVGRIQFGDEPKAKEIQLDAQVDELVSVADAIPAQNSFAATMEFNLATQASFPRTIGTSVGTQRGCSRSCTNIQQLLKHLQ
jgi:hypothetical protein